MTRKINKWTYEYDKQLVALRREGLGFPEIAVRMDRSIDSCVARSKRIKAGLGKPKPRKPVSNIISLKPYKEDMPVHDPMLVKLWAVHPRIMECLASQGLGVVRL